MTVRVLRNAIIGRGFILLFLPSTTMSLKVNMLHIDQHELSGGRASDAHVILDTMHFTKLVSLSSNNVNTSISDAKHIAKLALLSLYIGRLIRQVDTTGVQ